MVAYLLHLVSFCDLFCIIILSARMATIPPPRQVLQRVCFSGYDETYFAHKVSEPLILLGRTTAPVDTLDKCSRMLILVILDDPYCVSTKMTYGLHVGLRTYVTEQLQQLGYKPCRMVRDGHVSSRAGSALDSTITLQFLTLSQLRGDLNCHLERGTIACSDLAMMISKLHQNYSNVNLI